MHTTPRRILKTQSIRARRTDLLLLKHLLPSRPIFNWGAKAALSRNLKQHRFERIREILGAGDFRTLCAAIGFFDVNWALFEQSFDRSVEVVHQSLGGSTINKSIPRQYKQKSDFMRKAAMGIASLTPLQEELISLLDRADALADLRNDLIHGVVTQIESSDGRYKFIKADYGPLEHIYREFTFDTACFPKLVKELQALGAAMPRLGMRVNQIEAHLLGL